jgi:hypothetical protein
MCTTQGQGAIFSGLQAAVIDTGQQVEIFRLAAGTYAMYIAPTCEILQPHLISQVPLGAGPAGVTGVAPRGKRPDRRPTAARQVNSLPARTSYARSRKVRGSVNVVIAVKDETRVQFKKGPCSCHRQSVVGLFLR